MPAIHTPPPLLTPQQCVVGDEGEIVALTFGNVTVRMHYEEALRFSQVLRVHAKKAKQRAGDVSRHWSAIANLEGISTG